jgi:O-antigen/teichoic acid export membrane protein
MAFPIGEALNIQGMRLLVGLMLGPTAVTVFSTIRTLCRSAMKPTLIVARLIEPELALAFGGGRHDLIQKLFTQSSQVALWSALPVCLLLWIFGVSLLTLWTHGQIEMDSSLYILLLVASAANSLWCTALMVPFATNRHEGVAAFFLIGNGVLLPVAGFLMNAVGLAGTGVALLFFEISMAVCVLRVAFSMSQTSFWFWTKAVVRPPIPALKGIFCNAFFRS